MNRFRTIKKILNEHRAFSLAEMLIAILILLMVSSVVTAGIPAAQGAYEKVVKTTNAEVLLSTTISTLRNELGTARDVSVNNNAVTYYNESTGAFSSISKGEYEYSTKVKVNTILYQQYVAVEGLTDKKSNAVPLISEAVSTSDLYVTYSGVSYDEDNGIVEFTDISVNDADPDAAVKTLAGPRTIQIRVISY